MTSFRPPRIPVVSNVTAQPDVRRKMPPRRNARLTHFSVQWVKSIQWMEAQGVTEFLEMGLKMCLSGLNKRITKTATTKPIGTVDQIEKYIAGVSHD